MVLSARNFSNSEAYLYLIGRLDRKYVSKLMEAQVAVMKENIHKKVIAKGNRGNVYHPWRGLKNRKRNEKVCQVRK